MFELLKIFQDQITMIKNTIDKLVKSASTSNNELSESLPPTLKPPKSLPKTAETTSELGFDSLLQSDKSLTDLPPKPVSLQKGADVPFIGLPPVEDEKSVEFAPQSKPKKKLKKKELKAERDALESKVNSMRNLLDFIEKKFQAGSMDKKSYEKRTNQLKADLKKTEKNLKEINDLL